ncbi:MAG: DNA-processing protein DprA, partial [Vampirovibrionales bacterium]
LTKLKLLHACTQPDAPYTLLEAWNLPKQELAHVFPFLSADVLTAHYALRLHLKPEHALAPYVQQGIQLITLLDDAYPPLLREIYNPPALLFAQGTMTCLQQPALLAVVGTRKATDYPIQLTQHLLAGLANTPTTIISGLAMGMDAVAHRSALKHGLATVGVLACGFDAFYPKVHESLAETMVEAGGCILTEHPLGTPPMGRLFPQRNRIVVGCSQAILVAEAALKSGSMVTAKLAREENRQLLTLPFRFNDGEGSEGPLHLARQGATLVYEADHLKEALGLTPKAERPPATQLSLLDALPHPPEALHPVAPTPAGIEDPLPTLPAHPLLKTLAQQGGLLSTEVLAMLHNQPATELLADLALLELEGQIRSTAQGWQLL